MSNYSLAINYVKPDSMLQRSTRDGARHPTAGVLRCLRRVRNRFTVKPN